MATPVGPTAPALSELSRCIREYSLFQAVLLVVERLREAHPLLDEDALYDQLEFQANPSLGFPGHDIDQVEFFVEQGQLRARLRLNVLGLFGAGSPLPAFYGEQACAEPMGANITRDFLNVFHHRLQRLMLPIWRKYRYRARFRTGASDGFSAQMFALIGLGSREVRAAAHLDCRRLLPYLGLLGLRAHSASMIETVLRHYFKHSRVFIEQWVARRVCIDPQQRNQLGVSHHALGHDLVLGQQIADRCGKFKVHMLGLSWQRFHEFLPSGEAFRPLCSLVQLTARAPLEYDLRLVLAEGEMRALHLGERNVCRLGWTSWLAHERADGAVTLAGHSD